MREILKDSVIAKQTTNHEKKHNIHDAKYSNFVTIENQRLLQTSITMYFDFFH